MKFVVTAVVIAAIVSAGAFSSADAKKYTIYQRQVALKARIAKAERSKELTFKEAKNYREDLADIQEDKEKMISKNNGKLSYEDENRLEKKLNSISASIMKKKLEKRVD
ncbi:MAG: hypothetical protein SGJ27_25645 [Candidatus Melainabacteria bacterium]|nr:hypothetical protein [Candidatus Melainabacteria bacterium]